MLLLPSFLLLLLLAAFAAAASERKKRKRRRRRILLYSPSNLECQFEAKKMRGLSLVTSRAGNRAEELDATRHSSPPPFRRGIGIHLGGRRVYQPCMKGGRGVGRPWGNGDCGTRTVFYELNTLPPFPLMKLVGEFARPDFRASPIPASVLASTTNACKVVEMS